MVFDVYVTRNQISRANRGEHDHDTMAYHRRVRASTRAEAMNKCIASIWALCDDDIKIISVYAGVRNVSETASRLTPVQFRR